MVMPVIETQNVEMSASQNGGFGHLEAAGDELSCLSEPTQVTDFNKRQKRQNRSFRRIEVHGGYTGPRRAV
jgi:hypothetical protein